jgi:hypothetical protein
MMMERAQRTRSASKGKQSYQEPPSLDAIGEHFAPRAHAALTTMCCAASMNSDEVYRSAMLVARSYPGLKCISWGGLQRSRDLFKWRLETNIAEVRQILRQNALLVSAIEWVESHFPVVVKLDDKKWHLPEGTAPDSGEASDPSTTSKHMDTD